MCVELHSCNENSENSAQRLFIGMRLPVGAHAHHVQCYTQTLSPLLHVMPSMVNEIRDTVDMLRIGLTFNVMPVTA